MDASLPLLSLRELPCDWRLRPWPRPAAERRWRHATEWEAAEPPLSVWLADPATRPPLPRSRPDRPRHADTSQRPLPLRCVPTRIVGGLEAYLELVPSDVRAPWVRLPALHWSTLELVAADARARDLLGSNPALLVLLTQHGLERILEVRAAVARSRQRVLLGHRQTRVLDELGFPPAKAVRRMLQRVSPDACSVGNLCELRRVLGKGAHRTLPLTHVPRFDDRVLSLIVDDEVRPHVTPTLLLEVAGEQKSASEEQSLPGHRVRDCALMVRALGRAPDRLAFRCMAEVDELHATLRDDLSMQRIALRRREEERRRERREQVERRARERLEPRRTATYQGTQTVPPIDDLLDMRFWDRLSEWDTTLLEYGAPPLPETRSIRYVPTGSVLQRLAEYMGNCSFAYDDRCRLPHKSYALYFMPRRQVMIGLRRRERCGGNVIWVLDQVERRTYERARDDLWSIIRKWVASHGADPGARTSSMHWNE